MIGALPLSYSLSPVGTHRSSRGQSGRAFPSQSAGTDVSTVWDLAEAGVGGNWPTPGRAVSGRTKAALTFQQLQFGHLLGTNVLRDCSGQMCHQKMPEDAEKAMGRGRGAKEEDGGESIVQLL